MIFKDLKKYIGFFLLEYRRVKFYLPSLLMKILLISLRLTLPYSVFKILAANGQITKDFANSMLWAVFAGQIMIASSTKFHLVIKNEVKSGDIAIRFSEPVNYIFAKLSQGFGYFLPNYLALSIIFLPFLYFFFPSNINLTLYFLLGIFSVLPLSIVTIIVGLSSFIVEENDGIMWIISKLYMIFGNQIIPVALMPAAVISFAKITPFYITLAGPVEAASGRDNAIIVLLLMIFYFFLFFFFAQLLLKKLQKRLILNG